MLQRAKTFVSKTVRKELHMRGGGRLCAAHACLVLVLLHSKSKKAAPNLKKFWKAITKSRNFLEITA